MAKKSKVTTNKRTQDIPATMPKEASPAAQHQSGKIERREQRQPKARQPKALRPPTAKTSKPKKMSGLDAAAKVLAEAKEPLRCGELLAQIQKRRLWKSDGKTPAATINAAIIREIKTKGKESRFRRAGRGLFVAGA